MNMSIGRVGGNTISPTSLGDAKKKAEAPANPLAPQGARPELDCRTVKDGVLRSRLLNQMKAKNTAQVNQNAPLTREGLMTQLKELEDLQEQEIKDSCQVSRAKIDLCGVPMNPFERDGKMLPLVDKEIQFDKQTLELRLREEELVKQAMQLNESLPPEQKIVPRRTLEQVKACLESDRERLAKRQEEKNDLKTSSGLHSELKLLKARQSFGHAGADVSRRIAEITQELNRINQQRLDTIFRNRERERLFDEAVWELERQWGKPNTLEERKPYFDKADEIVERALKERDGKAIRELDYQLQLHEAEQRAGNNSPELARLIEQDRRALDDLFLKRIREIMELMEREKAAQANAAQAGT